MLNPKIWRYYHISFVDISIIKIKFVLVISVHHRKPISVTVNGPMQCNIPNANIETIGPINTNIKLNMQYSQQQDWSPFPSIFYTIILPLV
jgi:hypothetical protein